ncbi:uncharacterized protein Bfra_006860 [Botrytis fragariae]|uniref:Uncharacterized protein n=1 Tax=Botrytis fragariae TaxID=1964551 RepID=A0A8H6B573_9HELO|nr:uncharacterized protein Bfra_006860 [Botrytis fragariae]KAF5879653.1 hypothetical protein Bfra_006860 [Botrytis fragariae]
MERQDCDKSKLDLGNGNQENSMKVFLSSNIGEAVNPVPATPHQIRIHRLFGGRLWFLCTFCKGWSSGSINVPETICTDQAPLRRRIAEQNMVSVLSVDLSFFLN